MRWVLFGFTVPWAIPIGWGWVILMCLIGAASWRKLRWEPTAVLTTRWCPCAAEVWGYSTTIGRGIVYQPLAADDTPEPSTRIERHEHVHVRQVEDLMLLSFVVGAFVYALTGNFLVALGIWASGGAWQLPNFLTAAARYGWRSTYHRSEHELSAYSQSEPARLASRSTC